MDKWANYQFDGGSTITPEFKKFAKDLKLHVSKAANAVGMTLTKYSVNHFEVSGFMRNNETGKYAYFSVSDVRYYPDAWLNGILVRTAEDERDFRGGSNNYAALPFLASRALELTR